MFVHRLITCKGLCVCALIDKANGLCGMLIRLVSPHSVEKPKK